MKCSEKETLQQKCMNEWAAYETAVKESGFQLDSTAGTVRPPSISQVMSLGARIHFEPYRAVLRLRGEHLKASRELSLHLARHRC